MVKRGADILTATLEPRQLGAWVAKLKRDRGHEILCVAIYVFNIVAYSLMFTYEWHTPERWVLVPVFAASAWALRRSLRTIRVCTRDLGALGPARARMLTKTTARR